MPLPASTTARWAGQIRYEQSWFPVPECHVTLPTWLLTWAKFPWGLTHMDDRVAGFWTCSSPEEARDAIDDARMFLATVQEHARAQRNAL